MSSSKTPKLKLHSWEPTDIVKRTEFNDNFNKIDEKTGEIESIVTETSGKIEEVSNNLTSVDTRLTEQLAHVEKKSYVSVTDFGAKGDGIADDYQSIIDADNYANTTKKKLYFPSGTFATSKTLDLRAIDVEGESFNRTFIKAISPMDVLISFTEKARGGIANLTADGNGLAKVCIDSSFPMNGGSLNLLFERVFVRKYIERGWVADENNDVYFNEVMIAEPDDVNTSISAIKAHASGGPAQFVNCNFLDQVEVSAQYISFVNCVTKGIIVNSAGFNVLNFVGGYHYQSEKDTNIGVIHVVREVGPITLNGSHIELLNGSGTYMISGTGKLHYGVNMQGGHVFNHRKSVTGNAGIISPTVTSTYNRCTNSFANTWFDGVNIEHYVNNFILSYENCFDTGVPLSSKKIGSTATRHTVINGDSLEIGRTTSDAVAQHIQVKYLRALNVSNFFVDITSSEIFDRGIYLVMIASSAGDAPTAAFLVSKIGGYGNTVTKLHEAVGIGNYNGYKYDVQFSGDKLQLKLDTDATTPYTTNSNVAVIALT